MSALTLMKKYFILLILALAGCSTVEFKTPQVTLKRTGFGNKLFLKSFSMSVDSNGVHKVEFKGLTSDQVEAIGAIAEGVAAGMMSAAAKENRRIVVIEE